MELITGMATVWLALFLMWALVNRGVPVFQELIRDMTDFFMEKALGPGADLFEGRAGAGTVSWMFHGMLWTCIGGTCLLYTSDAADDLTRVVLARPRFGNKNKK